VRPEVASNNEDHWNMEVEGPRQFGVLDSQVSPDGRQQDAKTKICKIEPRRPRGGAAEPGRPRGPGGKSRLPGGDVAGLARGFPVAWQAAVGTARNQARGPDPRSPGGERVDAVTDYRRLATFERYALLEVRPRTGRLHQIRRHLKHVSHHVIGDVRYGKGEHNRYFWERFAPHRLVLHALEVAFEHPVTGVPVRVRAPLGEDLAGPFTAMGFPVPS